MMVLFRDVTELRRAEAAKRKLAQRMAKMQRLESLEVLAGGVAHDFNNILMAILGNLDLAIGELPESAPVRASLVAAAEASQKAAELARQMLAYSGRGRFAVTELRLNALVEEAVARLEPSFQPRLVVGLDLASDLPLVEADENQLRQVVTNLVQNAAEAIGDASGAISIMTSAVECDRERLAHSWIDDQLPAGRYVSLEVRDTGGGIDAGTRSRLFEPFFSTKFTGRGLGLPAVLGIVRGHKGAIEVHSAPGEGTRFTVLLPVAPLPAAP
jgi:signal transduction histidine kinase